MQTIQRDSLTRTKTETRSLILAAKSKESSNGPAFTTLLLLQSVLKALKSWLWARKYFDAQPEASLVIWFMLTQCRIMPV
jgi:hypothetical protein